MEKCDPAYPATRPITKEDLKDFKYDAKHKCDNCDSLGSYRTFDFWLCEKDMLEMMYVEIYCIRKIKYTVEYWEGYDNSFHPVMVFDLEEQAEVWAMQADNPKPIYIFKRALTEEQIKSIMKR